MPFTHTWEERGFVRRLYGVVTPEEMLQAFSAMATDARFENILYIINDARDADLSRLSEDYMKSFQSDQEVASLVNPRRIIANVIPAQDSGRLQRIHDENFGRMVKMKIFSSLEDARAWVDEWVRLQGR